MKLGKPFFLVLLASACGTVDSVQPGSNALDIQPRSLPEALVGDRYEDQNVTFQALHAAGPLSWSLPAPAPDLAWLAIEPGSGRLVGTPLELISPPEQFAVHVTDGTSTAQRRFSLSVSCREGASFPCGVPDMDQGSCVSGTRLCTGGQFQACQAKEGRPPYQADLDHCGGGCDEHCSRKASNRCLGACLCGSTGGPCTEPAGSCCPGVDESPEGFSCVSLQTVDHCGSCRTRCEARANTTPTCSESACHWPCSGPYRSCDGDDHDEGSDADGCETRIDSVANCGACGRVCSAAPPPRIQHVDTSRPVACTAGACTYTCQPGWGDCSHGSCRTETTADDPDGCETDFSNPRNCGGNGECPGIENGYTTCTLVGGTWTCGLGCNTGFDPLPCGSPPACRHLRDPDNCGTCGRACPTVPGEQECSAAGRCCVTECDPRAHPPCHTTCS
jgi:hypothetical protein